MFFFSSCHERETEKKIQSPHEESNLRPSDSAFRCSTTESQGLHGERGLLQSSYDTRPAYCQDQQCRQLNVCIKDLFLTRRVSITAGHQRSTALKTSYRRLCSLSASSRIYWVPPYGIVHIQGVLFSFFSVGEVSVCFSDVCIVQVVFCNYFPQFKGNHC